MVTAVISVPVQVATTCPLLILLLKWEWSTRASSGHGRTKSIETVNLTMATYRAGGRTNADVTTMLFRTVTATVTKTNGRPLLLNVQNACRTIRHESESGRLTFKVVSGVSTSSVLCMSTDGSSVRTTGNGSMTNVVVKKYTTRPRPCRVESRLPCVLLTPWLVTVPDTPGKTVAVTDMVTSEHGSTQTAHVPRHEVPLVMLNRSTRSRLEVPNGVSAVMWAMTTPMTRLMLMTLRSYVVIGFTECSLTLRMLNPGWHPRLTSAKGTNSISVRNVMLSA